MKKTVLMIVLPVVAIVCALVVLHAVFGIAPWVIRGAGPIGEREYTAEGFDRVEVSSAIEFELTQSADYSVRVTGYENLIERLEVELSGQTLVVRLKPGSYFRNNVKAIISMPTLEELVVSGACQGTVGQFASTGVLNLEVSGASRAEVDVEAAMVNVDVSGASRVTGALHGQNITMTVSGASRCELAGTADDMNLEVSGASRADLSQFQTHDVDANVSGASQVTIQVTGQLDVDLSGASSLKYLGNPVLGRVNVIGASRLSSE